MRRHHHLVPAAPLGAGPGKQVAVVGLGGLGHMAVRLAAAMGAEVTVLSQSLRKQKDGLRLGADHYHATSDSDTFTKLAGRFDLIVNTVSAAIDVDAHLALLAVDGALVNVGAPAEPPPRLIAGSTLNSSLGVAGPAVVGTAVVALTLIPTLTLARLHRRSLSGGRL